MKKNQAALQTAANRLLAADASRALIAAPGVGLALRIYAVYFSIHTAAAQIIQVGVAAGTVAQQFLVIPASATAPGSLSTDNGFLLPANTAFSAVPAAAGPAVQFLIEYEVINASV